MKVIKKEIVIDAPVAKVWEHITDPTKIAGWLMPNDFEAQVGRCFRMDCDAEGVISCVVKEIIPEEKLVYSFTSKDIKIETTVTITLTSEKEHTRLTLVHSGWDALPPEDQGIAGKFEEGWGEHLTVLQRQIAAAPTK
jgi:uncharacterized protein YndB with AHSA1/START domain